MAKVIDVTARIREYPDNSDEACHTLEIRPHPTDSHRCVLTLHTTEYIFKISDLEQALQAVKAAHISN